MLYRTKQIGNSNNVKDLKNIHFMKSTIVMYRTLHNSWNTTKIMSNQFQIVAVVNSLYTSADF